MAEPEQEAEDEKQKVEGQEVQMTEAAGEMKGDQNRCGGKKKKVV